MLLVMSAVQGVYFSLFLIGANRRNQPANRMLTGLLIVLAAGFISMSGALTCEKPIQIRTFHSLMTVITASGPLFYLYMKMLTALPCRATEEAMIHFLAAGAGILCLLVVNSPYITTAFGIPSWMRDHQSLVRTVWAASALPYVCKVSSLVALHTRETMALSRSCPVSGRQLSYKLHAQVWARTLLTTCRVYWLLNVVSLVCSNTKVSCFTFSIGSVLVVYVTGFIAMRNPRVFLRRGPDSPGIG